MLEESSGGDVLIRVALILLDEAGIQEYHAFVHDFQVRRHQIEVANELLVDQTVHLVRAPDLNNEGLMLSLLVLGRHHEVTTSCGFMIKKRLAYPEWVVKISMLYKPLPKSRTPSK